MRFELSIKKGNRELGEKIIILIPETATEQEIEGAIRVCKYAKNLTFHPLKEKEK